MPEGYKKAQKGDINLPAESGKRDPRLPNPKGGFAQVRESLSALKGVAAKAKAQSEEYKRRQK